MKKRQIFIALKALIGVSLVLAATFLILNLGTLKNIEIGQAKGTPPVVEVETFTQRTKTLVCPPQIAIMGLDATNPDMVTPFGEPDLYTSEKLFDGQNEAQVNVLVAPENAVPEYTKPATVLTVAADEELFAVATQSVLLETAAGKTALACQQTSNDQWIVAGDTTLGTTGVISITNPGLVPATVTLTVYDETGDLDARSSAGVLIAPESSKNVSLAGFGVSKESTVVRVQSAGAQVTASLLLTEIKDLTPTGAEQVNSQLIPATELVFAGIKNYTDHVHSEAEFHGDEEPTSEHADEFPAVVRIFSPDDSGTTEIVGLTKDGQKPLMEVEYVAGKVLDTKLLNLPDDVSAIYLRASSPIVAGIKTAVHSNSGHDFTWYVPTVDVPAGETVPVTVTPDGAVTLVNLSDSPQTITINTGTDAKPKTKEIKLGAWEAVTLDKGVSFIATGETDFAVGVLIFDEKSIASYPVSMFTDDVSKLALYLR